MDPSFTSGAPGRRRRLAAWLRTYRLPVTMTAVFVAALMLFAVLPDPGVSRANPTPEPTSPPPDRSPCIACGIGERCDESTGQCVLVEETPVACREGTHFSEEVGYCVPDPTPRPTAAPTKTLAPDALPTPEPTPTTPEPTPDGSETPDPEETPDGGSDRDGDGDGSGSSPQAPRTPGNE